MTKSGTRGTGQLVTFFKVTIQPVTTQPNGLTGAFGATLIDGEQLWLANITFGASQLFVLSPDIYLHDPAHVPIAGEMALCCDGHKQEVTILDVETGIGHMFFDFTTVNEW